MSKICRIFVLRFLTNNFKKSFGDEKMKKIYYSPSKESKVEVENNKVTYSDTEFCVVGEKPNMDFLKRAAWKMNKKVNMNPYLIKPLVKI